MFDAVREANPDQRIDQDIDALLNRLGFTEVWAARAYGLYRRGGTEYVALDRDGDWFYTDARFVGFAMRTGNGFAALDAFLPPLIGLMGFLPEAPL
jgi:hypothetical protein